MSTTARVLTCLQQVAETDQACQDLDIPLFERDILDSFGMVTLMVALSEEFGVEVSPAEIDRDLWATPRRIIVYMEQKVGP